MGRYSRFGPRGGLRSVRAATGIRELSRICTTVIGGRIAKLTAVAVGQSWRLLPLHPGMIALRQVVFLCAIGLAAGCLRLVDPECETEKDIQNDPKNCGACGNECGKGFLCKGGRCVCPPTLPDVRDNECFCAGSVCAGACRNTLSDADHCGACGNVCAPGQSCVGGVCGAS